MTSQVVGQRIARFNGVDLPGYWGSRARSATWPSAARTSRRGPVLTLHCLRLGRDEALAERAVDWIEAEVLASGSAPSHISLEATALIEWGEALARALARPARHVGTSRRCMSRGREVE